MKLSQEEKSQLKLFKQLLPPSTVIHFVLNAATIPVIKSILLRMKNNSKP